MRANESSLNFPKIGCYYRRLIHETNGLAAIRAFVVHPVDVGSLRGAIEAANAKFIVPVLVGTEAKIQRIADQVEKDISAYELVRTEKSHAAVARAVELARDHKVEALMSGSLHVPGLFLEIGPLVRRG